MKRIFWLLVKAIFFILSLDFAPPLGGATDRQVQVLPADLPEDSGEDYRALHGAVSEVLVPWLKENPDIESGKTLNLTVVAVNEKKRQYRIELRPENARAVYQLELFLEGACAPAAQKAVLEFESVLLEVARPPAKKESVHAKPDHAPPPGRRRRSGSFIYLLSLTTYY